jgi:hypothetical protein
MIGAQVMQCCMNLHYRLTQRRELDCSAPEDEKSASRGSPYGTHVCIPWLADKSKTNDLSREP